MMTAEEQKIFDDYQTMFGLPAWKKFMETVGTYKQNILNSTPYKVDSELLLGEVRGSVLDLVLGYLSVLTLSS